MPGLFAQSAGPLAERSFASLLLSTLLVVTGVPIIAPSARAQDAPPVATPGVAPTAQPAGQREPDRSASPAIGAADTRQDARGVIDHPPALGNPPTRSDEDGRPAAANADTAAHPAAHPEVASGADMALSNSTQLEPAKRAADSELAQPSAHPDATDPGPAVAPQAAAAAASDAGDASATANVQAPKPDPIGPVVIAEAKQIGTTSTDKVDVAGLEAFYTANPDRWIWLSAGEVTAGARRVIAAIGGADDWGLRASDFKRPDPPSDASLQALARFEATLSLAVLKYARHARGGRIDPLRLSDNLDRQPPLPDPKQVLTEIAASDAPDAYLLQHHPQHAQFKKLRQLYLALRDGRTDGRSADPGADLETGAEARRDGAARTASDRKQRRRPKQRLTAERVLLNMEQWRWMPRELGSLHVWNNIPEFRIRIMKNGRAIYNERMIVGKVDKQTPIFSKDMQSIVFHPGWGVPNSIKVQELLPGLLRGRDTFARNGLRATYRGRPIEPMEIDWTVTDIRHLTVIQPPGGRNVLGVVKFQFPNKHAIYMHDTPSKNLFKSKVRMFSHGCMRINKPVRLAEIILAETGGWRPRRVASLIRSGPKDNKVMLKQPVPVHVTYFTVTVGGDGKPQVFSDGYGHERKIRLGLAGKAHLIVKKRVNLSKVRAEVLKRAAGSYYGSYASRSTSWTQNVFNED